MTPDRKAKILERVRALLAKADSTEYPAEADTFRAKADELMVAYAIEQFEIDHAQGRVGASTKPVRRDIDFGWWRADARASELWSLFMNTASHCRCVIGLRGYNSGASGWRAMPILGLPSDIDYMDMLFTHLMLQMGKGLEPKPDKRKPMIENLVKMKEAGMKWERIGGLLYEAGQLDKPYTRNTGVRFTKLYTDYCDEHDRPRLRVTPSVFQRSFAQGFVAEIGARFREMRRASQETSDGSLLPAVRDIREQAMELYNELWEPDKSKRRRSRALAREAKIDMGAYRTGSQAGREASMSAKGGDQLRKTPELPK